MLKITAYAQRLLDDLEDVDYIERVKIQQRNWIGRSTGAEITFQTNIGDEVTVYTTRADTLFGTSYMVISPELAAPHQELGCRGCLSGGGRPQVRLRAW